MTHPNRSKLRDWPKYLREFRAKHGLSQIDLADLLMISARTYEGYEQDHRPIAFLKLALEQIDQKLKNRD